MRLDEYLYRFGLKDFDRNTYERSTEKAPFITTKKAKEEAMRQSEVWKEYATHGPIDMVGIKAPYGATSKEDPKVVEEKPAPTPQEGSGWRSRPPLF